MAFIASIIPDGLIQLESVYVGDLPAHMKAKEQANTASAILENQMVRVDPVSPNEPCEEVNAWYYTNAKTNLVRSGTSPDTTRGCDLNPGEELATESTRLTNNYAIETSGRIEAKRCNNAADGAMEFKRVVEGMMGTARRKLNNGFAIPLLANSAQVNVSPTLGDFGDLGTNNFMTMPLASVNATQVLNLEMVAEQNFFNQTVIVTGNNFAVDKDIAAFRALNDNERSDNAIYNASRIYFDTRNLDRAVTAAVGVTTPTSFIFDPSVFCFWSTQLYPSLSEATFDAVGNLVPEDASKNRYVFSVADPFLRYATEGGMTPVYHNFEAEYTCLRRNAKSGKNEYGWLINGLTSGGLHKAPAGFDWPIDDVTDGTQVIEGVLAVTTV